MWRTTYKIAINTENLRGRQQRFPNKIAELSFLRDFFVFAFCNTDCRLYTPLLKDCKTRAQLQTNIFWAQKEFSHIWLYAQNKFLKNIFEKSKFCIWLTDFTNRSPPWICSSFKQVKTTQLKCHSSGRSFQHNIISTEPQSYWASLLLEDRNFSPLMNWNFSILCLTRMQDTWKRWQISTLDTFQKYLLEIEKNPSSGQQLPYSGKERWKAVQEQTGSKQQKSQFFLKGFIKDWLIIYILPLFFSLQQDA